MSYRTDKEIMDRVQEHYNTARNLGYNVVGVFVQGSWNYGKSMCDDESDIDTKCLVVPSLEDICLNKKPVSITHIMENNEHIDIKDIRLYFECFKKQNINFVEILFSRYYILTYDFVPYIKRLFRKNEEIAHYNEVAALNCMLGMACEKLKALEHPYPATVEKIEKYGFDGKQLSHILRIEEFMRKYIHKESYLECLISSQGERLLLIKRNKLYDLEDARIIAQESVGKIRIMRDKYLENKKNQDRLVINKDVEKLLDEVLIQVIKESFKKEFRK